MHSTVKSFLIGFVVPPLFLQLLNINQVSVELEIIFLSSSVVFFKFKKL